MAIVHVNLIFRYSSTSTETIRKGVSCSRIWKQIAESTVKILKFADGRDEILTIKLNYPYLFTTVTYLPYSKNSIKFSQHLCPVFRYDVWAHFLFQHEKFFLELKKKYTPHTRANNKKKDHCSAFFQYHNE